MASAAGPASNATTEVKVTVTLVINASLSWLETRSRSPAAAAPHLATCVAVGLADASSVLLNLALVLVVCFSGSLQRAPLNRLVRHVAAACLLDGVLNAPFSLYYMRTNRWLLGAGACSFNAACGLLASFLITWGVAALCIERWASLFRASNIKGHQGVCHQGVATAALWIAGVALVGPVAFGLVEARAFPARYSCSVAAWDGSRYRLLLLVGYALPLTLAALGLLCSFGKSFRSMRTVHLQRTEMTYTELFFEESFLWSEWQSSKFVGLVAALFAALQLPHVVSQLQAPAVPRGASPMRENATLSVAFPVMQENRVLETACAWLRFLFALAFPLLTLAVRRDIWRKLCASASLLRAGTAIPDGAIPDTPDDFLVPQAWRRRRLSSVTCLSPPIAFGRGEMHLLDVSPGTALWKANGGPPKDDRPHFFDDPFDEQELLESGGYQDVTEEEICAGDALAAAGGRDPPRIRPSAAVCFNIFGGEPPGHTGAAPNERREKARRSSRGFKGGGAALPNGDKQRCHCRTFPRCFSSKAKPSWDSNSMGLLSVLKMNRGQGFAACSVLPRGTAELLDSVADPRDAVSL